jgi:hypothetical protein
VSQPIAMSAYRVDEHVRVKCHPVHLDVAITEGASNRAESAGGSRDNRQA